MMSVRSLPIRVAPIPGEAIDSWLEFTANRLAVSWGEMLDALGLPPGGSGYPPWAVDASRGQLQDISHATGVSVVQLQKMLLRHYNGHALVLEGSSLIYSASSPWTRRSGSRYCPECLRDSGGRWQLAWRLGWAFACVRHRCLLVDTCPTCGRIPRISVPPSCANPQPGHCASAPTSERPVRRSRAERCAADLTAACVVKLPVGHPVLAGQQLIDSVISTGSARFGVYRNRPPSAIRALSDVRVLAQRILTFSGREELRQHLPADTPLPVDATGVQVGDRYVRRKLIGGDRPTTAVVTAAGVVAALDILCATSIDDAGARMRWVTDCCRSGGASTSPAAVLDWGAGTSEVLDGVLLAAISPQMLVSDQLRFQTMTALPRRPTSPRSAELNRCTPSMLWPAWAQPLTVPGSRRLHHRLALSAAIQITGTDQTPEEACARLGGHLLPTEMSRVLKLFQSERMWRQSTTALVRMADFLAEHGAPIDYARRRRLDYQDLLPDDQWRRIYRHSDALAIGNRTAVAARMFLYELISGQPAARPSGRAAFSLFSFPRCLTPNLLAGLTDHGRQFLADHGIVDEPVTWEPPSSVFDGVCLPGVAAVDAIDRARLFELLRTGEKRRSMSEVAKMLGTTNDALYDHLCSRPLPPRPPESEYLIKAQRHHVRAAREKLPRERLKAMYRSEGLSIRTIATRTHLSRHTVREMIDEYGIAPPVTPTRNPITVDPDWVKEQYLFELRTFPEIAAEIGVSASGLTRWAHRRNIRRGGRGRQNHSAALNAHRQAQSSPPLLKAALAQPGGWDRLQRFRRVANFPSLDLAAESIGTTPCTLSRQIGRLERETGGVLIERATKARPMVVTEHGWTVIRAIAELEKVWALK